MGMNNVERISDFSTTEMREKDLIQPCGFLDVSRYLVKSDAFLPLKRPFLGENMDFMVQGKPPGYLQGVSFSPTRRNKAPNQDCDPESLVVKDDGMVYSGHNCIK
jgi:hypothetical protein